MEGDSPRQSAQLRAGTLGVGNTVAQSIAGMYPSASMAFLPLFVFLSAGTLTWATFLLAAILLGCVCYCGLAYARRLASSGSVYVYVAQGGGTGSGYLAAMAILWGYAVLAAAIVPFAAIYIGVLASDAGFSNMSVPVETLLATLLVVVLPLVNAILGIKFSSRLTTVFEFFSVGVIIAICVAVLVHRDGVVDHSQFNFSSARNIFLGLPLSLAAFTGWESAAALGRESRDPLRAIPRALFTSVAVVGIYYVIVSYIQVFAFEGSKGGLGATASPLVEMATLAHVGALGTVITIGILSSSVAGNTIFINASARIVYSMAQDGVWPRAWARLSKRATPAVASCIIGTSMGIYPLISGLLDQNPVTVTAALATLGAFGFMVAYVLVAVTAPIFVVRKLRLRLNVMLPAAAVIGTASLLFVIIANWIPPSFLPPLRFPYTILPYIFLGWIVASLVTYAAMRIRRPDTVQAMEQRLRSLAGGVTPGVADESSSSRLRLDHDVREGSS